jgi:hypothetical protein
MAQLTNVIVTPSMIIEYLEMKSKEQDLNNQSKEPKNTLVQFLKNQSKEPESTIIQFQEP